MKRISLIALLSLLAALPAAFLPATCMARVFRVFGPETFTRSSQGPVTQDRQFLAQYPRVYDFTLHIFSQGAKAGAPPSAVVKLNGQQIATPEDFNRNTRYIRKPVTLSDLNSLSVELHGNPGSEMKVVITARDDVPLSFDFRDIIRPDGSNLFGPNLSYLWTVVNKPDGANVTLNCDPDPSSPEVIVNLPGEYILQLVISSGLWKSEPIPIKLLAATTSPEYPDFIPVPVKTRVITGTGSQFQYGNYSIQVGSTIYPAPTPASGSGAGSGFQVLVLDRGTLATKSHQSFNIPNDNTNMVNFLSSLDNSSLVIVSSLKDAAPVSVCGGLSSCPLGAKLKEFGATNIFASNYSLPLSYTLPNSTPVSFSYSLIGIKGLGEGQGYELNNWDHKALNQNQRIYSNIQGSFVKDVNDKWTFTYPEFIEVETRAQSGAGTNTVKVGGVPFLSLKPTASGGFQVLVLDRDSLTPAASLSETNLTFSTNSGTGAGSVSESEQKRMLDFLNTLKAGSQKYVVVIASIGTPIGYKSTYFTELVKNIGDYQGGNKGILNNLGGATLGYSLVGMNRSSAYDLGSNDTVEADPPQGNLRAVLHKDRQGWFKPVIRYGADEATEGRPDFSLLSVGLQPATPWPLPDPYLPSIDPLYQEQVAAYQYISGHVKAGLNITDIRRLYTSSGFAPDCRDLAYPPADYFSAHPYFSESTYKGMENQLCGYTNANYDWVPGEFDYVQKVNAFMTDLDIALINMQISSSNNMQAVYDLVRSTVSVPDGANVLYDAGMVIRGLLTAGTSIVTNARVKGTMGVINGALTIAMTFSKKPEGADYTAIDTTYSNLNSQMNSLWGNFTSGSHILLDMVKSDWGKLEYVGRKFMTKQDASPADGGPGWMYGDTDPDNWNKIVTNSLQAYYFQTLVPTVWNIGYLLDTTIPHPENFKYQGNYGYCLPYCGGASDAYWVDHFPNGKYSWYVLQDEITYSYYGCATVHFSASNNLRGVLFGQGPWGGGEKLNLPPAVFYERWLPSSAYLLPIFSPYDHVVGEYHSCP